MEYVEVVEVYTLVALNSQEQKRWPYGATLSTGQDCLREFYCFNCRIFPESCLLPTLKIYIRLEAWLAGDLNSKF